MFWRCRSKTKIIIRSSLLLKQTIHCVFYLSRCRLRMHFYNNVTYTLCSYIVLYLYSAAASTVYAGAETLENRRTKFVIYLFIYFVIVVVIAVVKFIYWFISGFGCMHLENDRSTLSNNVRIFVTRFEL